MQTLLAVLRRHWLLILSSLIAHFVLLFVVFPKVFAVWDAETTMLSIVVLPAYLMGASINALVVFNGYADIRDEMEGMK